MYDIYEFDTNELFLTLPIYMTDFTLSPIAARPSLVATSAGPFDILGSRRSEQLFPHPLSYKCVATDEDLTVMRQTLDALRSQVGMRGTLFRRGRDDGAVHTCVARLMDMPYAWPYTAKGWFELTLNFEQLTPWRGLIHSVSASLSGSTGVTLPNNGNLPVRDVVITVTASGTVTALAFINSATGSYLRWTGTLASGKALVIDCGSLSVKNDGADNYVGISLDTTHRNPYWFEIRSGSNSATVTKTGGGATVTFDYRDGWA